MKNDTVELIDCLKVIWKRKLLIVAGAVLCAIIALTLSYSKSQQFRVETVLEVGWINVDGTQQLFEKPSIVMGRLKKKYWPEIMDEMGLTFKDELPIKVIIAKGASMLEVSVSHVNEKIAIEALRRLNARFLEKQLELLERARENARIRYERKSLHRMSLDADRDYFEGKIASLRDNRIILEGRLKAEESRLDALLVQKKSFAAKGITLDLVLFEAIEGSQRQLKQLRNQLEFSLKNEEPELTFMLNKKEHELKFLDLTMKNMENLGTNFKESAVTREPQTRKGIIKPSHGVYALLGAIVGLFLSVIGVFFMEYLSVALMRNGRDALKD
jgi:hypothetical protein